ncbi:ABC transporter substrate-binding protein [Amycolatopsis anabasis]|uniref:ABC transporter substrate-binding protein n=1 Tax=Amycolatopsis anabasis TaxID=1840409 RepID=UPI00131B862E|nr:ABC transporter substrate-binding protein [Amycolatopsis anabasis]
MAVGPFAVPGSAQGQGGKTLRVALVQQIDHLNPFTAGFASSSMIGRMAYEFLTLPSAEDATPTGGLAEKWDTSPDKLTWTFTIRQGVKWSDGKPVTAKDAAYTFNRIMTDEKAAEANGNYVTGFDTVTAPDDRTLVIKTKQPQSTLTSLDVPIVPEHVWSGIQDMADPKTDTPEVVGIGDGPFLITEYRPNEVVKLKANPDYWRGRAKIDELQFIKYDNADAAVNALNNGEVDVVNRLTPAQFESLQNKSGITTNKAPGRRYREMLINPGAQNVDRQPIGDGSPVLKDVRVRKAIAQAIDSKTIVDKVLGGYGEVATGLIPPVFAKYHLSPEESGKAPFDLAAASRALDQAGYPKGADGVRVSPDGKRLEFRLVGRASENFAQRAADYVTGWLGEIGIKVTKQLVSDNEVDEKTNAGQYDLAFSGYATNPDPDYTLAKQTCAKLPTASGGGSSASLFCDPEFDNLYQQQIVEIEPDKRAAIAKRAQQRYNDQAPSVVIEYDNVLEAYRSDKFAEFTKQPKSGGPIVEQLGYWSMYGATPAEEGSGAGGGSNTGLWIGIGVAAVVILVAGGVFAARRGKSADDRE